MMSDIKLWASLSLFLSKGGQMKYNLAEERNRENYGKHRFQESAFFQRDGRY